MKRGIRRGLGVLVLLACVLLPVVDLADTWDNGGTDTESAAVVVMLCVGAALVAGAAVRAGLTVLRTSAPPRLGAVHQRSIASFLTCSIPSVLPSPPLPLRV